MQTAQSKTYQNVMEELVSEEVNKQIQALPRNLTTYIEPIEVATYALNRLPPLYASSKQGKDMQYKRGKQKLYKQIATAVRQGLAAVQRDPLRVSTPLVSEEGEYHTAYASLQQLEELLERRGLLSVRVLSWNNLVKSVKHALYKVARDGISDGNRPELTFEHDKWEDNHYRR